jgi:predicted DCC family thiol-disulfide oxidoreductase YuxK
VGPEHDIVFYDGACGLCHRLVRFILKRDRAGYFWFAPLEGPVFRARVPDAAKRGLPDSIVVLTSDGRILYRAAAVREILRHLPRHWRLVGGLLGMVPRPIADRGYDLIARTRHHLFRRPEAACPVVPPELKERFL